MSDPLFQEPVPFVMEPADLVLPPHPDANDLWFCGSKASRIYEDLHVPLDPNLPYDPETNLTRMSMPVLTPYLNNLVEVTTELVNRANAAYDIFLASPTDLLFDNEKLGTTIHEIQDLHDDLHAYLNVAGSASLMPPLEQQNYLYDHVIKPVFTGNGFEVIGDESSTWGHFSPLFCEPIRLGTALDAAVQGHELKWKKIEKSKPRSFQSHALGFLTLFGVGYLMFKK